ncbi:MAG: DUF6562 domain-containing protein [Rikenellaceae bacterium]
MHKRLFGLLTAILLIGCTENHTPLTNIGDVNFAFSVSGSESVNLRDLNFYVFDSSGEMIGDYYYDDIDDIGGMTLPTGHYTFAAAVNCGEPLDLEEEITSQTKSTVTYSDFKSWMEQKAGTYYDAYTGISRSVIFRGDQTITITLNSIDYSYALTQQFIVTLPSSDLPEYSSTKADDMRLRVMASITSTRASDYESLQRAWLEPTGNTDEYSFELNIFEGSYSISLWADYSNSLSEDVYYSTTSGSKVSLVSADEYTANTPYKDGFAAVVAAEVDASDSFLASTITTTLTRPFARYSLVARDVDTYNSYREKDSSLPMVEDLTARISYEGYLPSEYNLTSLTLSDALTGYSYIGTNSVESDELYFASDYIFATGELFTSVTIEFLSPSGEVVTKCSGVQVDYAVGYHSTITGDFLTIGLEGEYGGGISTETEWDDDINFWF